MPNGPRRTETCRLVSFPCRQTSLVAGCFNVPPTPHPHTNPYRTSRTLGLRFCLQERTSLFKNVIGFAGRSCELQRTTITNIRFQTSFDPNAPELHRPSSAEFQDVKQMFRAILNTVITASGPVCVSVNAVLQFQNCSVAKKHKFFCNKLLLTLEVKGLQGP